MKFIVRIGILIFLIFFSINNLISKSLGFVEPPITSISGNINGEIKSEAQVKNISGSTINIKAKMTMVNLYTGHIAYFCLGTCFTPTDKDFVMPFSIALEPEEVTIGQKYFDLVLDPNGIEGQSIIKMTFFVDENPSDSIEYTVIFNSTTPVIELNEPTFVFAEPTPNPATDFVNFSYELVDGINSGLLEIYDNLGNLVNTLNLNGKEIERYNTALLPNGTYYAVMSTGDRKKAVRKFVVSH
ncbi:MAG: T9SS type A sorting domain-containing protein [Bacteroidetes bacterium]|nr:MAG: T9SS type A sorting domain-containing protein [Bacteroidota bacterium]